MSANSVLFRSDERGVATVTLNRPEVNNAYDASLIQGVLSAMGELGKKPQLRVVVLKGNGKHFQAGADLKVLAIAFQHNDAKLRLLAEFTQDRKHALNEAGIIGIVDLRPVQRDRRDPAFIRSEE